MSHIYLDIHVPHLGRQHSRRLRAWSIKKRAVAVLALAVVSWVIRHVVMSASTSIALRLSVNLLLISLLAWVGISFFRVLLEESEEEAKRNPRPW